MNKSIVIVSLILLSFISCKSQPLKENEICNQKAVDKSIAKKLPKSICIPDGYTIDLILTDVDFNKDFKNDIIIRYSKYPLKDGNMRYYSVYENIGDTVFTLEKQLTSLALPYVDNLSTSYLETNPIADSLVKLYPIDTKISFKIDTIFISHMIPDYYGKTYLFVYDQVEKDWFLEEIQYWIGELPAWLIKNSNLDEVLYKRIKLETKTPKDRLPLDKFDLKESKLKASEESDYFMNNYDIYDWEK